MGWSSFLRLGTLLFLVGCAIPAARADERPNVVLVLADDLGWADLGCYGADLHETPHLDQLAGSGLRFTHAYAPAPICSPTRAALLTGKAPARLQLTIWSEGSRRSPTNRRLLQAPSRHDLPHEELTLAELFSSAGYLTALVGKWHLGDADHAPETQGFDINIGGTRWGAPQTFFWPYRGSGRFGNEFRYVPGLVFGEPGEYLTDRLTDESLRIVDRAAATKRPFFLYLAHHAPHTPIEAKPDDVAYFQAKLRPEFAHRNPTYAAMVRSLDESVGRIRQRLRELDLEQNTLFIFTSDNGGYIGTSVHDGQTLPVTDNRPLRSGKGTCYEGGLRVPLLISWPGVTRPGTTCQEPVILTDLFRTLCGAAHLNRPEPAAPEDGVSVDGLDLAPLLRDPAARLERDGLYFHYPHYYHAPPSTPVSAVRAGDWKLLEFFEDQHVELYNLRQDPGEAHDLAEAEPERAHRLRASLHAWRAATGAALPTPNPEFPPQ